LDDLVGRLRADGDTALRAEGLTEPGVEDAQIVVDFRDGADCRTRRVARCLLLDADGRRQAADVIDTRLLHLAEELPGVRRERLQVAAAALGVTGFRGGGWLARGGSAGRGG